MKIYEDIINDLTPEQIKELYLENIAFETLCSSIHLQKDIYKALLKFSSFINKQGEVNKLVRKDMLESTTVTLINILACWCVFFDCKRGDSLCYHKEFRKQFDYIKKNFNEEKDFWNFLSKISGGSKFDI